MSSSLVPHVLSAAVPHWVSRCANAPEDEAGDDDACRPADEARSAARSLTGWNACESPNSPTGVAMTAAGDPPAPEADTSGLRERVEEIHSMPYRGARAHVAPTSLSLKFHARHYRLLVEENMNAVILACRSTRLAGHGPAVHVAEGSVHVLIDSLFRRVPIRDPDRGDPVGGSEHELAELTELANSVRDAMGEGGGGAVDITHTTPDGQVVRHTFLDPGGASPAPMVAVGAPVAGSENTGSQVEPLGRLEVSASVLVAGEGAVVNVVAPGAREGDAVVAVAGPSGEGGEAGMVLVAEVRTGPGGRARMEIPASAGLAGDASTALYLRAVRKRAPPGHGAADASPLTRIPVLPTAESARELDGLLSRMESAHGAGAREALAADLCVVLEPGGGGSEEGPAVLETVVAQGLPAAARAVLRALRRDGAAPPADALSLAVAGGTPEMVSLLADKEWGVDIAAPCAPGGMTPVHVAALCPGPAALKALASARGEEVGRVGLHVRDDDMRTPADLALQERIWDNVDAIHAAAASQKTRPAPAAPPDGTPEAAAMAKQGRLLAFTDPALEERYMNEWVEPQHRLPTICNFSVYFLICVMRILRGPPAGASRAAFYAIYGLGFVAHVGLVGRVVRGRCSGLSWRAVAETSRYITHSWYILFPLFGCAPKYYGTAAGLGRVMILAEVMRALATPSSVRDMPVGVCVMVAAKLWGFAALHGAEAGGAWAAVAQLLPWVAADVALPCAVTFVRERRSRAGFLRSEEAKARKQA